MTGSVNRVILLGNVGRDPEVRETQGGRKIANFSIATSDTWKDKSGERQERVDWHRISVFNEGLVGIIEKYVSKGSRIYIEGSIQGRRYTGTDGVERNTTEIVVGPYNGQIVLLDSKPAMTSSPPKPRPDDDIPF